MKQRAVKNEVRKRTSSDVKYFDYDFLITVILLVIIGGVMVFSASYQYSIDTTKTHNPFHVFQRQLIWSILGIVAMWAMMNFDYRYLKKLSPWIYLVVNVALVLTLLVGKSVKGARRWLGFGDQTIQPSELMKIALIIFLAYLISTKKLSFSKLSGWLLFFVILVIPVGLIILQPNLSMVILLGFGAMVLLFVAAPELKYIIMLGSVAIVGVLGFILMPGEDNFRKGRFEVWLNPWIDPNGTGFQTVQSLLSVGNGGLFGRGLGESVQKFGYIPEAHNDIIFAIIVEELGLIGAVAILLLFLMLIWKGIKIAMNAPDEFGCLTVIGIISILAVQVMINVSVVTNTIPVTGVTLPFISYGGSSIIFTLASMGIILNVSKQSRR